MTVFNQRITRIHGLSDRRRLPRLGIIRLGIKKKSAKSGKEYPAETEYFVVPPEVEAIYGPKPTALDIMLPINEIDAVFPQSYKFYGSSKGLKCHGDGKIAFAFDGEKKDWVERECPCEMLETGKCKQSATLMFILPKVSVGGVYQIRTSSFNSIVDINSGLDYITALVGRFAMIPLTLKREQIETHHDEKKQYHYTLKLLLEADINTLNLLRQDNQRILERPQFQLPAPIDENPEFDPPDILVDEEDQPPPAEPEPEPEPEQPPLGPTASSAQHRKIFAMGKERELDRDETKEFVNWVKTTYYPKEEKLSMASARELIDNFDDLLENYRKGV